MLFSRFFGLDPSRADARMQHFRAGVQEAPEGYLGGVVLGICRFQMEHGQRLERGARGPRGRGARGAGKGRGARPGALGGTAKPEGLYSTSLQWHHPLSIQ